MKIGKSGNGFTALLHPPYIEGSGDPRIVTASSAIGNYDDSFQKPGSSFFMVWVSPPLKS